MNEIGATTAEISQWRETTQAAVERTEPGVFLILITTGINIHIWHYCPSF